MPVFPPATLTSIPIVSFTEHPVIKEHVAVAQPAEFVFQCVKAEDEVEPFFINLRYPYPGLG
jgi:hypothetical protein